MTACIYHKSLQINMLACTELLAVAPGAPELLLCIEWRYYHCPDLALWQRLGLIILCGGINSQHNSLGWAWRKRRKQEKGGWYIYKKHKVLLKHVGSFRIACLLKVLLNTDDIFAKHIFIQTYTRLFNVLVTDVSNCSIPCWYIQIHF